MKLIAIFYIFNLVFFILGNPFDISKPIFTKFIYTAEFQMDDKELKESICESYNNFPTF